MVCRLYSPRVIVRTSPCYKRPKPEACPFSKSPTPPATSPAKSAKPSITKALLPTPSMPPIPPQNLNQSPPDSAASDFAYFARASPPERFLQKGRGRRRLSSSFFFKLARPPANFQRAHRSSPSSVLPTIEIDFVACYPSLFLK